MHWDAATAAADPPEEPPGTLSMSYGLQVTCNSLTISTRATHDLQTGSAYSASADMHACKVVTLRL